MSFGSAKIKLETRSLTHLELEEIAPFSFSTHRLVR